MRNAIPDKEEWKKPREELEEVNPLNTWLNPSVQTLDQLKSWILIKLGAPTQTVELSPEQLDVCIADAIQLYSKYAWRPPQYLKLDVKDYKPGKGWDLSKQRVMSVKNIATQADNVLQGYGDLFFSPYAAFGQGVASPMFGMGGQTNFVGAWTTFHNLHEWYQCAREMMGNNPDFQYSQTTKHLKLMPEPHNHNYGHIVLAECQCEAPMHEYFGNEYVKRIALANAKILLGTVRKKFQNVPLPGGGTVDTTIGDEGREELQKIQEEIIKDEAKGQAFYVS